MGRPNARRIGKRMELELVNDINSIMPEENARRQPMSGAIEELKGDVISKNLHVEAKRRKSLDVNKNFQLLAWVEKIEQEERDTPDRERIPMVVLKKYRGRKLVVMDWLDFLNILKTSLYPMS
jgi:hypothetical protein